MYLVTSQKNYLKNKKQEQTEKNYKPENKRHIVFKGRTMEINKNMSLTFKQK